MQVAMVRWRNQCPAATRIALAVMSACIAACASSASSGTKPSTPATEAALSKMFSDSLGKAEFSCRDGGSRYDFICQGRYVPFDRTEGVVAHRIGVSVSHYFEGEPVFAISVLRDDTERK